LPPLLVGEPPSFRQVVEAQNCDPPVGWKVLWKQRQLGWALTDTKMQTDTKTQPTGLTEIHGRVHFDEFPIGVVTSVWLRPFLGLIKKPAGQLRMDAGSELLIDAFGRLLRFDSAVQFDPLIEAVSMHGTVEGGMLELQVRAGSQSFSHEVSLPPKALLSDALSPQTRLPGLHVDQEWSVPIFNPLWPTKSPIEIIRAKVEGSEPIFWNGMIEETWLVVYRHDSGIAGNKVNQNEKGRLWVRRDGAVLQQQAMLFDSTVLFIRMADKETEELLKTAGPRWWAFDRGPVGKKP
jgi:hypothetical protein